MDRCFIIILSADDFIRLLAVSFLVYFLFVTEMKIILYQIRFNVIPKMHSFILYYIENYILKHSVLRMGNMIGAVKLVALGE